MTNKNSFTSPGAELIRAQTKTPRQLLEETICCFECKQRAEIDGYRFRLVPVCRDCRKEREVETVGNRFERRHKK